MIRSCVRCYKVFHNILWIIGLWLTLGALKVNFKRYAKHESIISRQELDSGDTTVPFPIIIETVVEYSLDKFKYRLRRIREDHMWYHIFFDIFSFAVLTNYQMKNRNPSVACSNNMHMASKLAKFPNYYPMVNRTVLKAFYGAQSISGIQDLPAKIMVIHFSN